MSIVGGSKLWYNTAHSHNGTRKALIVMFWTLAWNEMSLSPAVSWAPLSLQRSIQNEKLQLKSVESFSEQSEPPIIFYRCQSENFPGSNICHAKFVLGSCTEETWFCVQVTFSRRPGPVVSIALVQVKFLYYSDSFWIIRTDFWLSGQLLDYLYSFWIVRAVFGLAGQFLGYPDSFQHVSE